MELSMVVMYSIIANALSISGAMEGYEADFVSSYKFKTLSTAEVTILLDHANNMANNHFKLAQSYFNLWRETGELEYMCKVGKHNNKHTFWVAFIEEVLVYMKNQGIDDEITKVEHHE